jgi:hypothetical protein
VQGEPGDVLEDAERVVCDGCLPTLEAERTATLAAAGKAALAAMRASANDPARAPEARAKQAETARQRSLAIRAGEREHGKVVDRERYELEILPAIQRMTVPTLMAVTGLSQHHLWQVRTARKRLHPMHWGTVLGHQRTDHAHARAGDPKAP